MSLFLRLPWILGGPTPATRTALTTLLGLDESVQRQVTDAVRELALPHNKKKLTDKAQQLHEELKALDTDTIYNILDSMTDLVAVRPSDLPQVLSDIFKDTATDYSALESMVKGVTSDAEYVKQRAIEAFKREGLPNALGFEHFCAIRARFENEFRYNEDNIESYNPKVADYHPVVVCKIALDDPSRSLGFQLDEERLDRLITDLIAAQKQLKVLVEVWSRANKGESNAK